MIEHRGSTDAEQPGHQHNGQPDQGAYRPWRTRQQDSGLPLALFKQLTANVGRFAIGLS